MKFDFLVVRSEDTIFFFTREDIDVVMVTEKCMIHFSTSRLNLRRKRTLSLGFVKMVNRINLTIFNYNPDLG